MTHDTNIQHDNLEHLKELLGSLSPEQQAWLGGYLTALNQSTHQFVNIGNHIPGLPVQPQNGDSIAQATPRAALQKPATIKVLYGTRTGNAKQIAELLEEQSQSYGLKPDLVSMADYNPKHLKKESHLLIIVSTDGEGEPPVSAQEFYDYLHSTKIPDLSALQYSVLALGDSSYKNYCQTGKDIDNKLSQNGAVPIVPRVDCDLDFEDPAEAWIKSILTELKSNIQHHSQANKTSYNGAETPKTKVRYTKKNPYKATITDKILLNGKGSSKETYHYELSIENSGLVYKPGDAVGVISHNTIFLVDKILEKTGYDPNEKIQLAENTLQLRKALVENLEITTITKQVLENYGKAINSEKLLNLLNYEEKLNEYLYGLDALDLIIDYPGKLSAQDFANTLRKLQPRLYSIASSQTQNPDEVHLTVATVKYNKNNRDRHGVCSTFLSDNLNEGDEIDVYIDQNLSFKLPEDPSKSVIMIGAGTGIAPFRAFLQEREETGAEGKNWLFFGDRNFTTDFLYQTELQKYLQKKILSRLDLAFSRDQNEKIYVQHKLKAQANEVFNWLQNGAHLYLCGDKEYMASDVKQTLIEIFKNEGSMNDEKAREYFKQLQKNGQYQEDVY